MSSERATYLPTLSPLPNGDILNSSKTIATPFPIFHLLMLRASPLAPLRLFDRARPSDTGPCPTGETRPDPRKIILDVFRPPFQSLSYAHGRGRATRQTRQTPHRRSSPNLPS